MLGLQKTTASRSGRRHSGCTPLCTLHNDFLYLIVNGNGIFALVLYADTNAAIRILTMPLCVCDLKSGYDTQEYKVMSMMENILEGILY